MLETEIKKLTAALEANTAALTAGSGTAPVEVPNVPAPAGAPSTPAAAVAPIIPPPAVAQPTAPVEFTKDQVLQELSAVNQKMADNGAALNAMFAQHYPGHNLTSLDPAHYGNVITLARALVV